MFPSLGPLEDMPEIPICFQRVFMVLRAEVVDMSTELKSFKEVVKTTAKELKDTQVEAQAERKA